ncbi:MAG: hypothetical protein C4527_13040 [Candidatus Omnitrophota bacterium]|nr:MAG: hypothetical protein C4527_13040 [Candidatus Omnitrophota bacterium]
MKEKLKEYLINSDWDGVRRLASTRKIILSKLLSFTFNPDEEIRWKAVDALQIAVGIWIKKDVKAVREFCRRLFWMLNDESGNMGWFAPQAIGAVLAGNHEKLANFFPMLISVLDGDERPEIVKGVLWALGHIGPIHDDFAREARFRIQPYLLANNAEIREEAVKVMQKFNIQEKEG